MERVPWPDPFQERGGRNSNHTERPGQICSGQAAMARGRTDLGWPGVQQEPEQAVAWQGPRVPRGAATRVRAAAKAAAGLKARGARGSNPRC